MRAARSLLPVQPGVLAAWVGGSLARGQGDAYSDVDLNCLVTDESIPYWRTHWSNVAADCAGELVLARTIDDSIVGGFSLTADWKHVDLIVHRQSSFVVPPDFYVVYDPRAWLTHSAKKSPDNRFYDIGGMCEFFLYLAGSFATLIGRDELLLAQRAVIDLREWLIRLMIAENGNHWRSGQRRLNKYLTEGQRGELEALPTASASSAEATAAARAVFHNFVHRGRVLANRTGVAFPEQMLLAADQHLHRTLGSLWPSSGPMTPS